MIRERPGTHCELCYTPARPDFYARKCKLYHGIEYLCQPCKVVVDLQIGVRTLEYLQENDGCLFYELIMAEDRLSIDLKSSVNYGLD
jgi:hypothetical protein